MPEIWKISRSKQCTLYTEFEVGGFILFWWVWAQSRFALNVIKRLRKVNAACPEVMINLSWRTCDFAHLPFLKYACAYKENDSPCAATTIHYSWAYASSFSYCNLYVCNVCSSQVVIIQPGGEGEALVKFAFRLVSDICYMQGYNMREDVFVGMPFWHYSTQHVCP